MLSEPRGIEKTGRTDGIGHPNSWRFYPDFEGNSSAVHTANPVVSRSSFVIGIAIKQASLIVFVSDQTSTNGSIEESSRAYLLAAISRLLPKGDVVRILNVANTDLRRRLAKFRDQAGSDRCLFLDLRFSADSAIEQLARALLKMEEMDGAFGDIYADAVGLAIAARLLGNGDRGGPFQPKRSCGTLPKWRLKRVLDYIELKSWRADHACGSGCGNTAVAYAFRRSVPHVDRRSSSRVFAAPTHRARAGTPAPARSVDRRCRAQRRIPDAVSFHHGLQAFRRRHAASVASV